MYWNKRYIFGIILLVGVFFCLSGCVKAMDDPNPDQKIGIAMADFNVWNRAASLYVQRQASTEKQLVINSYAVTKTEQIEQLGKLRRGESKVAIVQSQRLTPADIDTTLIQYGIPVILFEHRIDVDYTCFVRGDDESAGRLAGEYIASHYAEAGILNEPVLIIDVDSSQRSILRTEACIAALRQAGVNNIIRDTVDSYTTNDGTRLINALIADGTVAKIKAVYTQDDAVAEAFYTVLDETLNPPLLQEEEISGLFSKADGDGDGDGDGEEEEETPDPPTIRLIVGTGGMQSFLHTIADNLAKDEEDTSGERIKLSLATTYYPAQMSLVCLEAARELILTGGTTKEKDILIESAMIDVSNYVEYINSELLY